jgi:hypothetical protein
MGRTVSNAPGYCTKARVFVVVLTLVFVVLVLGGEIGDVSSEENSSRERLMVCLVGLVPQHSFQ